LIATIFKNSFTDNLQGELYKHQPLCCKLTDPGNTYLQILPNIVYTLLYGLDFYINDQENSKRRALGMFKATLYSGLVTDLLKHTIYEKRPNGGGTSSFPSGHTTSAFAFASFVASEHPWYVGIPAYVLASYVGFCRLQDNHHYLQDVLAGATIGMSYGIALSLSDKSESETKSALMVLPTEDISGLAFKYSFQY
jgi:membrane-associated phospholipid phosphatase